MPMSPLKPCRYSMCPTLTRNGYCERHKKDYNKSKRNTNEWSSWYSTSRWRKARLLFLTRNPLCNECGKEGRLISANVVDHIIDHKGDLNKFWDINNWQSLCKRCHDKKTINTNLNKDKV